MRGVPRIATAPLRALRTAWHFMRDPSDRDRIMFRLFPPKGMFQPFNDTTANRYPKIFRFVQSEMGRDSTGAILSFGCSTGEEVFSLQRYFPQAAIKGIDINPRNIAMARRRLRARPDPTLTFHIASSTRAEPSDSYDAIFCMATLRHGSLGLPGVTRCDHLIRFDDFAEMVADFGRCLKPGGLMVLGHSNFRLMDTPAAARFWPVLRADIAEADIWNTPIFGRDNRLIEGLSHLDLAFRKRSPSSDPRSSASLDDVSSPSILR